MRLLLLFLFFFFLAHLGTSSASPLICKEICTDSSLLQKKVSIALTGDLKSALEILHEKYSISFLYVEEQVPWHHNLNISFQETPLSKVLTSMLAGTALTYFLLEDQIGLASEEITDSLDTDSVIVVNQKKQDKRLSGVEKNYTKVNFSCKRFRKNSSQTFSVYLKKKPVRWKSNQGHFRMNVTDSIPQDTLNRQTDTLSETNKKPIVKKIKVSRELISGRRCVVGIQAGAGIVRWRQRENQALRVEDLSFNQYRGTSRYTTVGITFDQKFRKDWWWCTGLFYQRLHKKGTITSRKINHFYPSRAITETTDYDYYFSYIQLPLGVGYETGTGAFYFLPKIVVYVEVPAGTDMAYFPVYQTQYFASLNIFSKGNGTYYDKQNNQIMVDQVKFTRPRLDLSLSFEMCYLIHSHFSLSLIPAFYLGRNIHPSSALVREIPMRADVSLSLKYDLRNIKK